MKPLEPHTSCCTLADIKPLRLLILLASVAAFAASLPQQPVEVGVMTPVYRMAPRHLRLVRRCLVQKNPPLASNAVL